MSRLPNILFVCDHLPGSFHFLNHLEHAGCRLLLASDTEDAARLLLAGMEVDLILVRHETIASASLISSALKVISPLIPVLLLTAEWPRNGLLPVGVDAVCCAHTLGRRAARDIAGFVRYLLTEVPNQLIDNARYDDGRFVPQKPGCLN